MEADLGLIQTLATQPVENATIWVHQGDRHQELIPPSRVWREGTKILIRCELLLPGRQPIAIKGIDAVELRLDQRRLLLLPIAERDLPFGITLELAVLGPEIAWKIGKKK